jgi:hypothetical protein
MRVTDLATDKDTEAVGPAIWGGCGEVYIVNGERVEYHTFRKRYAPQPERRIRNRRDLTGRRWRDNLLDGAGRRDSQRVFCRRMRDRLTERELLQLARGIEYVEISLKGMP